MGRISRVRKIIIYLKPPKFVKKKKKVKKFFRASSSSDAMALAKNDAGIRRSAFTSKSPRHFLGLLGAL